MICLNCKSYDCIKEDCKILNVKIKFQPWDNIQWNCKYYLSIEPKEYIEYIEEFIKEREMEI